jgi:hypothetical protein
MSLMVHSHRVDTADRSSRVSVSPEVPLGYPIQTLWDWLSGVYQQWRALGVSKPRGDTCVCGRSQQQASVRFWRQLDVLNGLVKRQAKERADSARAT